PDRSRRLLPGPAGAGRPVACPERGVSPAARALLAVSRHGGLPHPDLGEPGRAGAAADLLAPGPATAPSALVAAGARRRRARVAGGVAGGAWRSAPAPATSGQSDTEDAAERAGQPQPGVAGAPVPP